MTREWLDLTAADGSRVSIDKDSITGIKEVNSNEIEVIMEGGASIDLQYSYSEMKRILQSGPHPRPRGLVPRYN